MSDDERIECNIHENNNYNNRNDDNDTPPPPAAAAMLIAADQVERSAHYNTTITAPYIPTTTLYNVFSWIGYSLYSLTTIPSLFYSSSTQSRIMRKY